MSSLSLKLHDAYQPCIRMLLLWSHLWCRDISHSLLAKWQKSHVTAQLREIMTVICISLTDYTRKRCAVGLREGLKLADSLFSEGKWRVVGGGRVGGP